MKPAAESPVPGDGPETWTAREWSIWLECRVAVADALQVCLDEHILLTQAVPALRALVSLYTTAEGISGGKAAVMERYFYDGAGIEINGMTLNAAERYIAMRWDAVAVC